MHDFEVKGKVMQLSNVLPAWLCTMTARHVSRLRIYLLLQTVTGQILFGLTSYHLFQAQMLMRHVTFWIRAVLRSRLETTLRTPPLRLLPA